MSIGIWYCWFCSYYFHRFQTISAMTGSFALLILLSTVVRNVCAKKFTISSVGLTLHIDSTEGIYSLLVDGKEWLNGGHVSVSPYAYEVQVINVSSTLGRDALGSFEKISLSWANPSQGNGVVLTTSFLGYDTRELILFRQEFPNGYTKEVKPPQPQNICVEMMNQTDQAGGHLLDKFEFKSTEHCCNSCQNNSECDAWVASTQGSPLYCYLTQGHRGFKPADNRICGNVRGVKPSSRFISSFPSFSTQTSASLGYLTWGGCQIQRVDLQGLWNATNLFLDGVTSGEPLLLHDFNSPSRAISVFPTSNFFISGQANMRPFDLSCGIRLVFKYLGLID